MLKLSPSLTFNDQAEEAIHFYTTIFDDAKIIKVNHFEENEPGPAGSVSTITFELFGQEMIAVNGGPDFKFGDGISLYINCDTQEEIDRYWEKLAEGGTKQPCGWVIDKYGVSWQVAPTIVGEMLKDPDPKKVERVNKAIFEMEKIDLQKVQDAYAQE